MTNLERCSCGARDKNKCSKESEHKTGKMCLKDGNGASVVKTSTRYLDTGEVVFGDDITVTTPLDSPLFNMTPKWWNREMLVEMDKKMLACLIRGCDPTYEIMDHPMIKSKGQYWGGHNDRWEWNFSSEDFTEEQLWETYQLLKNPQPKQDVKELLSEKALYSKLKTLSGVTEVVVHDQGIFE